MDSLLRPRERPGSTASEVTSKGRVQTLQHLEAWGGAVNPQGSEVGLEEWLSQLPG